MHCFGSEVGMDDYVRASGQIASLGATAVCARIASYAQLAGQHAVDAFGAATLQMDGDANSSTVTTGRLAGFGGAPNMGSDARGRRRTTPASLDMMTSKEQMAAWPQAGGADAGDL
jgi:malonate decarboxylase alpha subunit